jgi:cytidine deaminase
MVKCFGSNQEKRSLSSGLCAERVVIFHAGAIYPTAKILKMATAAAGHQPNATTPAPGFADNRIVWKSTGNTH